MASKAKEKNLKSFEIVTLAVYLLGGESKLVDTEDVAVKANELAPGLFTWRKYKDQISFDHVRRQLADARAKENVAYLVGSVPRGWQLTPKGLDFARSLSDSFGEHSRRTSRIDSKEQMRLRLERERMRSSKAYAKYNSGAASDISIVDANAFFRIDEYVPSQIREGKLLRIQNNFADDSEFAELIRLLLLKIREGESNAV